MIIASMSPPPPCPDGRPCDRKVQVGNSFQTSFCITAYVRSDSYVYFRGEGPAAGASTQVVLPPATVASTVTAVGTSMPFVATPAPVVEQPGMQAKEFPTLRLSESPKLLPSFGLSSSSPSPKLPWGAAEDLSPPFLPNRVQVGRSQAVPDEDSSFSVSLLSPGLFFRPPRGSTSPPAGGVLLPTTLDDFDDSVLGDAITYALCEQFPGSESPFSLPVYVAVKFGRSAGPSSTSDCVGFGDLRSANGGVLDCCPSHGLGRGRVIREQDYSDARTDSWSPAVCCLQMETRHMVSIFIIFVFWSSWKLRSWPGSSLVVPFMYEL